MQKKNEHCASLLCDFAPLPPRRRISQRRSESLQMRVLVKPPPPLCPAPLPSFSQTGSLPSIGPSFKARKFALDGRAHPGRSRSANGDSGTRFCLERSHFCRLSCPGNRPSKRSMPFRLFRDLLATSSRVSAQKRKISVTTSVRPRSEIKRLNGGESAGFANWRGPGPGGHVTSGDLHQVCSRG